ncbi:unnamed protein product, partial [Ranitomeya imitator]
MSRSHDRDVTAGPCRTPALGPEAAACNGAVPGASQGAGKAAEGDRGHHMDWQKNKDCKTVYCFISLKYFILHVYEILNSAELLCLRRNLVIPSPLTAECMVAANPRLKDFCDSTILCLAFVTVPDEREHWILVGTQSGDILAAHAEDVKTKHRLQKLSDSITCFLFSYQIRQSQKKYFLLVGTANGHIAVFEAATIKSSNVTPMKILNVGDIRTPVMSLCESTYSSEKTAVWGICGTKILFLSNDFSVQKTIETKNAMPFSHGSVSDSNITSVAVDKYIYVAKKYSPYVEIWDKKTEKLCEVLDCAQLL